MAKHFKGWRKHIPPVTDLNGDTAGINVSLAWTEGDGATAFAPTANVTSSNGLLVSLSIVGSGIVDGVDEVLVIGGTSYPLNANKTDTGTGGSTTFSIAYTTVTHTFAITKNGGGTFSDADCQTLVRAITYNNVKTGDPTEGDRTFSVYVMDAVAPSATAVATVAVTALTNILPVVDLNGAQSGINLSTTFSEGDGTASLCASATVSDDDSDPLVSMTIVGASFTADDEIIKLGATPVEFPVGSNLSTTATAGSTTFAVAFTTSNKTWAITKNGGGTAAASEWQTLLRTLSYVDDSVPVTTGNRTLTITVNDGTDNSTPAVLTIAVSDNDPYTPNLPESYIDTTYSLPVGGTTRNVNAGGDLQAALNASQPGDVVVIEAGATFTGRYYLPATDGSDWIYVISSALASLPAGTRVLPNHNQFMPKLLGNNGSYPVLFTMFGAKKWRVCGVEVTSAVTTLQIDLIRTGYDTTNQTTYPSSVSQLPEDIIFDRCYVHSSQHSYACRMGINFNGINMSVIDSHVANCKDGADAQAILIWNGPGPYKIANNFLEGTGENFMSGGNDPSISGLIPSDIEFRQNYVFKRLNWKVTNTWNVKNSFELKNARRVHVEGNIFENNWADAQNGWMVLFTPRNQAGTAPQSGVTDVTWENNLMRRSGQGFSVSGGDNFHPSTQTTRIKIHNNVIDDIRRDLYTNSRLLVCTTGNFSQPTRYLSFTNNTHIGDQTAGEFMYQPIWYEYSSVVVDNYKNENNFIESGHYTPDTLTGSITNGTFTNNVIYYDPDSSRNTFNYNAHDATYPGNFKEATIGDVGFEDIAGRDYHLDALSDYFGDGIGADVDAVEAELPDLYYYLDLDGASSGINSSASWAVASGTPAAAVTVCPRAMVVYSHNVEKITSATLTVAGVLNGVNEVLTIGGTTFPLNADKTATGTSSGTTFSIAYVTATGVITITKSGGGSMNKYHLETLLYGMTYVNSSGATAGTRTIAMTFTDGTVTTATATASIVVTVA